MATVETDPELTKKILERATTIAVVGASANPNKPAHTVPARMQQAGFRILPVNPTVEGELFGEKVYASLAEVPEKVDVVDVFRRSEDTPEVARAAVEIGAGAIWLQQGIVSEESRRIAEEAGIDYVEDHCVAVERARYRIDKS
ncbi:MAG: CoA-binding protein [Actinomycetota bacterium]